MDVERRADRAGKDLSHRKRLVPTDQSPAGGSAPRGLTFSCPPTETPGRRLTPSYPNIGPPRIRNRRRLGSSKYPPAEPGALVVSRSKRPETWPLCGHLSHPPGGYFSSNRSWSCRRSSRSCSWMYARMARSSRPTVDTQEPRAQKCCPTKLRGRPANSRAMWIALFPLMSRVQAGILRESMSCQLPFGWVAAVAWRPRARGPHEQRGPVGKREVSSIGAEWVAFRPKSLDDDLGANRQGLPVEPTS